MGQSPARLVPGGGGRSTCGQAPTSERKPNDETDPQPEREARPVAPERRRERDPAPPAAGEEVDCGEQERQERDDQDELHRPSLDDARVEVEVGRRVPRERDSLVERAEQRLRSSTDLPDARVVQAFERVGLRSGWARAGGGEAERRNACADERRLLVEAEREGEVDQLAGRARAPRLRSGPLEDPRSRGLHQCCVGRPGTIGGDLDANALFSPDRDEVDGRRHASPVRRGLQEPRRSEAAVRPAVG